MLFTSRLILLPVRASASHRSMNTSPRFMLPLERKAIRLPSFERAGARKIWPPLFFSVRSGCEKLRGLSRVAAWGKNLAFIASRQSSLSS